ncbi:acetyltransferase, GNAT family protein [Arthrobacter crystallopoietes BAB-32]|uniref:Acetyltransferase, GNAT family protein n=1 Tax=Arthrobacter crystallopoietes BAB-32 TaxID=1246476 RepID=N1UYP5_9MICC|nr:N-acetyltransferase [Arthrobacter crystallopoietes]EMY32952.1 acetyltransferase, GNAT family protein [Arthrobacter crystallopoietes BAB-32]
MTTVHVRSEHPDDRAEVLRLTARAFAGGDGQEPVEVRLLSELFGCDEYLPDLSVVAEAPAPGSSPVIAGHSITTRGWIDGQPALGLGPISVLPEYQGQGIGAALLEETRLRAVARGEAVIVLLGHTGYYPRFGYRPAAELGIQAPDPQWGAHFMALPLSGRTVPRGLFRYAAPFSRL